MTSGVPADDRGPPLVGDAHSESDERDEFDRQIDRALAARFTPSPFPKHAPTAAAEPVVAVIHRGGRRPILIAAATAMAAGAVWLAMNSVLQLTGGDSPPITVLGTPARASRPLDVVYRERVDSGFTPDWVCENDEEFAATFGYKYGERLAMAPLPEGSECVGLAYATALTRASTLILVRVGEKHVVLFVDRITADDSGARPEMESLHLFKKVLGNLVLYEASPLSEPSVLQHMTLAAPTARR